MSLGMTILLSAVIAIGMAVFMEGVAWATHKYVMHGFLWVLHEDHHHPRGHGLQKNDAFAAFFATISIILIYTGATQSWPLLAAVGFGMALYGMGYITFHDIMFHRRIPGIRYRPRSPYMKRIVNAHKVHHRNPSKENAKSFSFLYAPKKYAPSQSQSV